MWNDNFEAVGPIITDEDLNLLDFDEVVLPPWDFSPIELSTGLSVDFS